MGVLYGLFGASNVDMSARAFRYGYCQCTWQSWCWEHNRDCWACASAWSAGFAQGEAAAAAPVAQEEARLLALMAQWEADLEQAEGVAAAAAAQEEARADKKAAKKADKKAKKKSKAEGSGGGEAEKKFKTSGSDGGSEGSDAHALLIGT